MWGLSPSIFFAYSGCIRTCILDGIGMSGLFCLLIWISSDCNLHCFLSRPIAMEYLRCDLSDIHTALTWIFHRFLCSIEREYDLNCDFLKSRTTINHKQVEVFELWHPFTEQQVDGQNKILEPSTFCLYLVLWRAHFWIWQCKGAYWGLKCCFHWSK